MTKDEKERILDELEAELNRMMTKDEKERVLDELEAELNRSFQGAPASEETLRAIQDRIGRHLDAAGFTPDEIRSVQRRARFRTYGNPFMARWTK